MQIQNITFKGNYIGGIPKEVEKQAEVKKLLQMTANQLLPQYDLVVVDGTTLKAVENKNGQKINIGVAVTNINFRGSLDQIKEQMQNFRTLNSAFLSKTTN